jgi:hypothetical protein
MLLPSKFENNQNGNIIVTTDTDCDRSRDRANHRQHVSIPFIPNVFTFLF